MGEGSDGGGKLAGEFVVGEEEELESGEVGEGGNGTVETVAFKAEDAELGEEGEGEDGAGEVEVFEDEAGDAVVVVVAEVGDAVSGLIVGFLVVSGAFWLGFAAELIRGFRVWDLGVDRG